MKIFFAVEWEENLDFFYFLMVRKLGWWKLFPSTFIFFLASAENI